MPKTPVTSGAEMRRVGKFGAVGVINTLIDFVLYNVIHFVLGLGLIPANIISTTTAMLFSFVMNKQVVFKKKDGSVIGQAIVFFAITAFGLYVLQNSIIHFLTDVWVTPMQLLVRVVRVIGLDTLLTDAFVVNNGAKVIATVVSLLWNYVMYKKVVFKHE